MHLVFYYHFYHGRALEPTNYFIRRLLTCFHGLSNHWRSTSYGKLQYGDLVGCQSKNTIKRQSIVYIFHDIWFQKG